MVFTRITSYTGAAANAVLGSIPGECPPASEPAPTSNRTSTKPDLAKEPIKM